MVQKETYRQWLSCLMALTVSFVYGCKVGWTSANTILFLSDRSPISATQDDVSWMVSVSYTGTIFSVLLSYFVSDKVSRKNFILAGAIFYALAWTLILFTSSMALVVVCFFFYGIACSMLYIVCNIYIGEVASPKNRELIGASYNLATAIGSQVEFLMSSFDNYRWMALFPLLVSVFALLISNLMVESPYYLVGEGKFEPAFRNLCYLNGKEVDGQEDAAEDLETVKKYVNEQKAPNENKAAVILMPANLRLTLILIVINGVSIMNCSCVISVTGSLMINDFKDQLNGNLFVNVYNSLAVVFMFCSFGTIKKFTRRRLFLVGYAVTGLVQLLCAVCYYVQSKNNNSVGGVANFIAFLLITFLVVYKLTFAVALEILKGEIFPHRLKEFYFSVLCFTSDCFSFAVVKSYFFFEPLVGNASLMLVYTFISLLGAAVVYIFVPDTKGKSLQQIRTDLNAHSR